MINTFYENLAKLTINYSIGVKKGDRVLIQGPTLAEELFRALYAEIIKAGGHPFLIPQIEGTTEIFLKNATDEQLEYVDDAVKKIVNEFDCSISIVADYNTHKLSLIDPKVIAKSQSSPAQREIFQTFVKRIASGDLRWVAVPFPCNSFAQEANMDLLSYFEFIKKALLLDKESPVDEWIKIDKKQEKIVSFLNKVEKIQVIGEDTDLTLSSKGRIWINCCGHENMPDGEVFTSPVEDSVNGHIRFTYPGIYMNNEIENIYLEFVDGKVVKATADKGENVLLEVIAIENADKLGEFAIGTNYGINQFTKNMLFDEKMGGTIHCALGMGLPETGAKNVSAIHWDILKDMKSPGSKILADGKIIYEEGMWKI